MLKANALLKPTKVSSFSALLMVPFLALLLAFFASLAPSFSADSSASGDGPGQSELVFGETAEGTYDLVMLNPQSVDTEVHPSTLVAQTSFIGYQLMNMTQAIGIYYAASLAASGSGDFQWTHWTALAGPLAWQLTGGNIPFPLWSTALTESYSFFKKNRALRRQAFREGATEVHTLNTGFRRYYKILRIPVFPKEFHSTSYLFYTGIKQQLLLPDNEELLNLGHSRSDSNFEFILNLDGKALSGASLNIPLEELLTGTEIPQHLQDEWAAILTQILEEEKVEYQKQKSENRKRKAKGLPALAGDKVHNELASERVSIDVRLKYNGETIELGSYSSGPGAYKFVGATMPQKFLRAIKIALGQEIKPTEIKTQHRHIYRKGELQYPWYQSLYMKPVNFCKDLLGKHYIEK